MISRTQAATGSACQEDRSVREVGPGDDFLDAIENDRPRSVE
jgi:hypothetical protein